MMFFGKHQAFVAQTPMDGSMGMSALPGAAGVGVGMPGTALTYGAPELSGYAQPGLMYGGAPLPGYQTAGMTTPGMPSAGMPETVYATHTEYDVPGCPPVHFGHTQFEVAHAPRAQVHVVQPGDTVYNIARSYGLDWREVAGYNHLGNPNLIYPGQRLLIPVH